MILRYPQVFTRARAAACSTLALLALRAAAQTAAPTPATAGNDVIVLPTFSVSTSQDVGYRAGNSVSATRVDTPIKDLPFAISAFTEQFITDIGARDLFDVVQYAPSVTSAGKEFNAGNAVFTIRGFDQSPQHNGFVGEGYVDTSTVERVEVVKGPSSLLYGQVAPGGTVNYITKRAGDKARTVVNGQYGTQNFWRTAIDVNQPILGHKLLFRFNGVYENGRDNIKPSGQKTRVLAPTFTWNISDRIALTVDYQWFQRREHPPGAHIKPNTEIVGLPGANGILSATGLLINPLNNIDPGFLTYYPLPEDFNYVSKNDYRATDYESLNAELTAKLSDHWTARANFNWNKRDVAMKLTGLGAVSITVPTSYYPAGASLPISAANYRIAALAYAADLMKDINLALLAPQAQLGRRKRLQEDWGFGRTSQVEFAGSYVLNGGVKLKPLVGLYYNESQGKSRLRSSATANFFPVWDMKNPATWNYDTDFDVNQQPLTTNSRSPARNAAAYTILNASLMDDRLNIVAGARYNKASGSTDNFLAPASSVAKVSSKKTTPQLGAGYKLTRDMMLYASYSQSFVNNASALQKENVPIGPAAPTTAEGYEVGVKTDFLGGRVSSTIAAYQIDQKDRILRFNSFNSLGVTVTNSLQGTLDRSKGLEGEITWSPRDNLQVYLSGAIDSIKVIKVPVGMEAFLGSNPEATVRGLANLWTRYSFQGEFKGLWVGAGFNYTGKKAQRTNNPALFLPAETLWNSAIGYDWKQNGHDMSAVINWQNMGNIEYFPANQQRGLPGRATLSVTAKF